MAHDAWGEQRSVGRWQTGAVRDDERRLHPDLVPSEELPEDRRDINRHHVDRLPAMLGAVGLALTRPGTSSAKGGLKVPASA
jgi:hypothetical protein